MIRNIVQRWFPPIYIVRDPESGEPVLERSQVPVRMVVEGGLGRRNPVVRALSRREINAAWKYYREHKAEIDVILWSGRPRVVLTVELSEPIERMVAVNLGRLGYTVITAANGTEGNTRIQTESPGIIIGRGEPGIETCLALQKANISIPFILLVGRSNDREILKIYEAGIAPVCISVPFNPMELVSLVERIFRVINENASPTKGPG